MNFRLLVVAAALSISSSAMAQEGHAGGIALGTSFARASVPGQSSGVAYLALENRSGKADALVAVTSPLAQNVEMHTMAMQDNVMRMREVSRIELPPGSNVVMHAGEGCHLMLMGLKAPLKAGEKVPLALRFERAGKIQTSIPVKDNMPGAPMNMH
jgi:copper(I)-binding protein